MILITGGTGRLGSSLKKQFPNALFPTRSELDLISPESIKQYVKKNNPSVVIHAAAMTSIRECEEKKELCWKTNAEGTRLLVQACLEFCPEAYFVYISTPCVFDGIHGMYTENDLPMPKNVYGLSKFVAENSSKLMKRHLVVRTNFVAKQPWPYEGAFTDRFGTYLFADDVAFGVNELIAKELTGLVHLVGDKKISMYELSLLCGSNPKKITMKDYSGPVLPVDMTLDTVKWKKYKIGGV